FLDAEVGQQMPGMPRVLGTDRVDRAQRIQRTRRQVGEVADRRGDDVEGSGSGLHRVLAGVAVESGHSRSRNASMRHPWKQALAATLAALVFAGCSTVQVTRPAAPPPSEPDAVATGHWQFDAGDRPPAERDGYRSPCKLAVRLPITGSLATASGPVRDGLLAGYYGEQRRSPDLEFDGTMGTAWGAVEAYRQAVAD